MDNFRSVSDSEVWMEAVSQIRWSDSHSDRKGSPVKDNILVMYVIVDNVMKGFQPGCRTLSSSRLTVAIKALSACLGVALTIKVILLRSSCVKVFSFSLNA